MFEKFLFPLFRPRAALRPRGSVVGDGVTLRWLGTAGFVIETTSTTVVLDPFVTRPALSTLAFTKLVPDMALLHAHLPEHVDAVVCSHGHYDHLLDGPALARVKGAAFVGSTAACAFAYASGVPRSRVFSAPASGASFEIGEARIELVPSAHARLWLGRTPLDRPPLEAPRLPARLWDYRAGPTFGVLVRTGGISVYLNASADLADAALTGRRADVALVGLAGREVTRDYLGRLLMALEPSVVVPCHHDAFFGPLGEAMRLLPGVDLDGFALETATLLPRATVITPLPLDRIRVPRGDPRAAGLLDRGDEGEPERAIARAAADGP